jgi:xanthine dehydrogenase accessory factor
MSAERAIVAAASRLRRQSEPAVVATVVRGANVGARMLLSRYRWFAGAISGGCLEGDFARDAWARTAGDRTALATVEYADTLDRDVVAAFGIHAGPADVLLERAGRPGRIDPLELAATSHATQRRAAVATVIGTDAPELAPIGTRFAIRDGETALLAEPAAANLPPILHDEISAALFLAMQARRDGTSHHEAACGWFELHLEAIAPPPRLFVFGTGPDALAPAQLAQALGWDVVVCAPGELRHTERERFALADEVTGGELDAIAAKLAAADRAYAVVMNHDAERDRACLEMLAASPAVVIGVLGRRAGARGTAGGRLVDTIDPRVFAGDSALELAVGIAARGAPLRASPPDAPPLAQVG